MNIEAVIFDFGRTLYNHDTGDLIPQSIETLSQLRDMGLKLGLVSIALTDDLNPRLQQLDQFGLTKLFQSIDIQPRSQIGKDFTKVLSELSVTNNQKCLVVGDNLKRDIACGNVLGTFTVWTRQNLSANWQPQNEIQQPKAIIERIQDLVPLIKRMNFSLSL